MNAEPEAITAALRSDRDSDRVSALLTIAKSESQSLSEEAIAAIGDCLAAASKTIRRRAADALAAAARRDARVASSIRTGLKSNDPRIRFGTAYALGAIDGALDFEAAPALCEALGDSDGDVRWAAAELIVRLGGRDPGRLGADLLDLLRGDNAAARKMALYCIRDLQLRGEDALAAATASTHDADGHVRLAALALLASSFATREEAVAHMIERLEADSDAGVRRAAAVALGSTQGNLQRVNAALRHAAAQSTDESLARAARNALQRVERG
jgi:HEAT repeat protein